MAGVLRLRASCSLYGFALRQAAADNFNELFRLSREEDGISVDKVAGDAGGQLRIQVRWRLPIETPRVFLLFQSYLNARR